MYHSSGLACWYIDLTPMGVPLANPVLTTRLLFITCTCHLVPTGVGVSVDCVRYYRAKAVGPNFSPSGGCFTIMCAGPFDVDGAHVINVDGSIVTYCFCERDRQMVADLTQRLAELESR